MSLNKHILSLLISLLVLVSCECPPSANTPQVLTPSEYANICFVNTVHNTYSISIDTKYGYVFQNLLFRKHTQYEKIGSGNNYINLKYNIFDFYKVPIKLDKDTFYTFIPAGSADQVRTILLKDDVKSLDKSHSHLRIVNGHSYLPKLRVESGLFPDLDAMSFGDATEFKPSPNRSEFVRFFVEDEQVLNLQVQVSPGSCYSVVPFYNPGEKNIYGLTVAVIELKIP